MTTKNITKESSAPADDKASHEDLSKPKTDLLTATPSPDDTSPPQPSIGSLERDDQGEKLPRFYVTDVSSVLHNGQWYHASDDIALSNAEAAPLLLRRIIEPIQEFNQ